VTRVTKITCPPERDEDVMRSFANDGAGLESQGATEPRTLSWGYPLA